MAFGTNTACACGAVHRSSQHRTGFGRRGLLGAVAAGAALVALRPVGLRAQSKEYRAMLLSCVDPRTQAPIAGWMDRPAEGSHSIALTGLYSQFTIAGAGVGVTAPEFAGWRETFWANLGATISLHGIRTLVAVDHQSCGAVGIAYGERVLADPTLEKAAHLADAKALQQELSVRHPDLAFQSWYVSRDAGGAFNVWDVLVPGPVIT
jgi:hypothetical protein